MHFEIEAESRQGLRIIDDIPDIGLCKIEGHNGVGKSAAVRLLELCTGGQSYDREPQSWRTLREQLVSAHIKVTGLAGAHSIEINADPRKWPASPGILSERHLEIRVDGVAQSTRELRQVLRVHRLVGHETLTDTLAFQVDEAASAVRAWITGDGSAWQRRARLDDLLADAIDLIPHLDLATYHEEKRRAQELRKRSAETTELLLSTEVRRDKLAEAVALSDQLDDVREQGPGLESQLRGLNGEIETLDQELGSIEKSITQIAEADAQDRAARIDFEKAQRNFSRKEQDLRAVELRVNQEIQRLRVKNVDEAQALLENLKTRLDQLVPDSSSLGPALAMNDLLHGLTSRLTDAERDGLGEQVIIEGDLMEAHWTVSRLHGALRHQLSAREAQLRAIVNSDENSEIAKLRGKVSSLSNLITESEGVPRLKRLLESAREKLRKATNALPPSTGEALTGLFAEKSRKEGRRQELVARKEQIEQAKALLGGGLTQQVLNQRLARVCRELDVESSRLHAQRAVIQSKLDTLRSSSTALEEDANLAESKVAVHEEAVESACSNVRSIPWLPNEVGEKLRESEISLDQKIALLAKVSAALERVRTRLDAFTRDVQSLAGSLEGVAGQFRSGARAKGTWVRQIYAWLAEEVRQWFDHEQVRLSLFEGGHSVELNLASMEVSWTVDGSRRTRPLEAFSSGEQAVAYTRARLARLEREADSCLNRLIVLDEFGAFISDDSMRSLTSYLNDRRTSFPSDQLLVVLPLSRNYSTVGGVVTAEVVDSRRHQLRQRGYFAEEFAW